MCHELSVFDVTDLHVDQVQQEQKDDGSTGSSHHKSPNSVPPNDAGHISLRKNGSEALRESVPSATTIDEPDLEPIPLGNSSKRKEKKGFRKWILQSRQTILRK